MSLLSSLTPAQQFVGGGTQMRWLLCSKHWNWTGLCTITIVTFDSVFGGCAPIDWLLVLANTANTNSSQKLWAAPHQHFLQCFQYTDNIFWQVLPQDICEGLVVQSSTLPGWHGLSPTLLWWCLGTSLMVVFFHDFGLHWLFSSIISNKSSGRSGYGTKPGQTNVVKNETGTCYSRWTSERMHL